MKIKNDVCHVFVCLLLSRCLGHLNLRVLCILTSERVPRLPFAGQNQIFNAETTFCVLLSHKMYKIMQKITKNHVLKGGLPAFILFR